MSVKFVLCQFYLFIFFHFSFRAICYSPEIRHLCVSQLPCFHLCVVRNLKQSLCPSSLAALIKNAFKPCPTAASKICKLCASHQVRCWCRMQRPLPQSSQSQTYCRSHRRVIFAVLRCFTKLLVRLLSERHGGSCVANASLRTLSRSTSEWVNRQFVTTDKWWFSVLFWA
jgi:hypothetical protein